MTDINVTELEQFSLKNLSIKDKFLLLKELHLDSDGTYVLKDGERIHDKYLGVTVRVENMLIFPGSTIVLDNNELSVAMYLQEYGNDFK